MVAKEGTITHLRRPILHNYSFFDLILFYLLPFYYFTVLQHIPLYHKIKASIVDFLIYLLSNLSLIEKHKSILKFSYPISTNKSRSHVAMFFFTVRCMRKPSFTKATLVNKDFDLTIIKMPTHEI